VGKGYDNNYFLKISLTYPQVANNGLHYGLYHVPGEHLGGYYDRGDVSHPRNVPIPVAVAPTLDMGLV